MVGIRGKHYLLKDILDPNGLISELTPDLAPKDPLDSESLHLQIRECHSCVGIIYI